MRSNSSKRLSFSVPSSACDEEDEWRLLFSIVLPFESRCDLRRPIVRTTGFPSAVWRVLIPLLICKKLSKGFFLKLYSFQLFTISLLFHSSTLVLSQARVYPVHTGSQPLLSRSGNDFHLSSDFQPMLIGSRAPNERAPQGPSSRRVRREI